jgi:hypothetical protein
MPTVRRHKRMIADTDAIRALGTANSAHAADLIEVASTLSSLTITAATLGPIGARFAAALAEAVADGARAVSAAGERLSGAASTADAAAAAYDRADDRAGARITGV